MLPVSEFRVLDVNSAHWGVPVEMLMEQAGCAVSDLVLERFPDKERIAVVCGSGNNGGDGFVAARHLLPYREVEVLLVKHESSIRTDVARRNYKMVEDSSMMLAEADIDDYDLVVDAVLGLGVSGELREPHASALNMISSASSIVSVDCPSGFGTAQPIIPDITVTFHDLKEGMDEDGCGEVVVADIGIPTEAATFTGPGEALLYPLPPTSSHKGQNGRVLVLGGGPYTGAPALAALAAYRIGSDLVHIATPWRSFTTVASYSPMFITHCLSGDSLQESDVPEVLELAKGADALLMGPGLGDGGGTLAAVRAIIEECNLPMILDADAVSALGQAARTEGDILITPHSKELERLVGSTCPSDIEDRTDYVCSAASALGATILLKGPVDVISDGDRCKLNRSGCPAMTVGGTGDVLAGICAGLAAKGMGAFDASRLGAYIGGNAGERAEALHGHGMMATDMLDHIGPSLMAALDFGRGI